MLKSAAIIFSCYFLLFIGACNDVETPIEPVPPEEDVKGIWVSKNADIALLLQDSLQELTFTFETDSLYSLQLVTLDNDTIDTKGSYLVGKELGTLNSIILTQSTPTPMIYQGICEISQVVMPNELTLEFLEVFPDSSQTPPTVEEGFGSSDEGNLGIDNIQKFRKVE